MPFVGGRDDDNLHPGRKRRWEDGDGGLYRLYDGENQPPEFYLLNHPQPDLSPRKIIPLSKRARISDDEDVHPLHDDFAAAPLAHRRRLSPQHKILQDQRHLGNKTPPTHVQQPVRPTTTTTGAALLAPCHICHRKPTKKTDLDSFAECLGCGERTCFVCIRECPGWNADEEAASVLSEQEVLSRSFHMDDADDMTHDDSRQPDPPLEGRRDAKVGKGWDACGHRAVVCSRCCVERGREGEVVCLGCLSGMPGA
ncbi:DNL zinc finger domain-containing protein [Purpureocillium lavendulum]|uniref:DNL zinc finger domain-containing protein n=1 Tax=Purpureocillium lavendulum TaxID=1247861 RepID=A0AB34G4C7_9HYPO|nr:DNL zinc finger domain-containing protein [Purpureocillium lavendulum]